MRQAGFLQDELARLESAASAVTPDSTPALREKYSQGVRANDTLRQRLQDQLAHFDDERRRWQDRLQQQQSRLDALERDNAALRTRGAGVDEVDAGSPLRASDLSGLCRDLNRSLHASQALQRTLDDELLRTTGKASGARASGGGQQKEVEDLRQQLADLKSENAVLKAHLASLPKA